MKKKIAAAALAGFCAASAMAAGAYDGIYVNLANPSSYLSVHTNGNTAIVTGYSIISATGIVMYTSIGNVYPKQMNTWELLQGNLNGSVLNASGQILYNACNIAATLIFNDSGASMQLTSSTNTLVGSNSGINCAALTSYAQTTQYRKIF